MKNNSYNFGQEFALAFIGMSEAFPDDLFVFLCPVAVAKIQSADSVSLFAQILLQFIVIVSCL
jgi:hypothetical protein